MLLKLTITFLINLPFLILLVDSKSNLEQLPHCVENSAPGLVLVSTIDGKFSAVDSEGVLKWQIDTDPGPLLTSNIHNIELTNSGKWVRIIPSLTGSLFRFDGKTVDQIPISAESLLKSSFKYSDDIVIAGGFEVRTYGVGFRSGKIFYSCSAVKCSNDTNDEVDDVLLVERSTQTVRAIEPQSGHERWNFSVGHHNVKLPQISCIDPNANLFNWNLTAIIPDGILVASNFKDNVETSWQYHFPSPIVRVWKWNGHRISEIDLFSMKGNKAPYDPRYSPAIYLGMHKKQLYIHESYALQRQHFGSGAITESTTLVRIPWKPVSASGLLTEEDSTALSVLYSSEYINGNGYYLFSESDVAKKNSGLCENNNTIRIPALTNDSGQLNLIVWWKEILVVLLTTALLFNTFRTILHRQQEQNVIFVERGPASESLPERVSESSDSNFISRYMNDFDTLRCLGKGGFGIVFEVKQKIDECNYAIKRIALPNEENKRDTVMREVKALAKLEHHNIVRYFNSWVEKPPYGWQQQHDYEWLSELNECITENPTSPDISTNNVSVLYDANTGHSDSYPLKLTNKYDTNDSFIVFDDDCDNDKENSTCSVNTIDRSNTTSMTSYVPSDKSFSMSENSISWKKPSRRSHNLNELTANAPVFLYIQMQLCQRQSLKEWLADNKERHFPDVLHMFKQILSAVEYVHLQGLIHRDLKPSNIFFSLDGQIKVGDFGLVKDVEEGYDIQHPYTPVRGHTKEVGTRLYMSPEQLKGKKYNYKVDIYSLGLIFYELLVYFNTDMERIHTLTKIRDNDYPKEFTKKHPDEHNLLTMMLCQLPEKRLTTIGIRARSPINCCDDYNEMFDFEMPKFTKSASKPA